jgi:hypothetical protein
MKVCQPNPMPTPLPKDPNDLTNVLGVPPKYLRQNMILNEWSGAPIVIPE